MLISPGPGIASEAGDLLKFIKNYYQTKPMLGICLGYEAIAEVFGASIMQLPAPMHGMRNKGLVIEDHYIFDGIPDSFYYWTYHSWILDKKKFPSSLKVNMRDELGLPMALTHRKYDLTGLMFHPESIMTEYGFEMIRNWLFH